MNVTEATAAPLQWPDYLVISIVLSISASIGIYYRFSGGRQKTAEKQPIANSEMVVSQTAALARSSFTLWFNTDKEYFSANHSMRIPLLSVALMVAFISAIALLGTSAETYNYGAHYVVIVVGYIIATPVAAFLYLPVFYGLQNLSVYEYLEKRFGSIARLTASLANFCQMGLYTGVVLYAPALALEATIGLSSTMSILLIGLICTFYSSIGGIKAVLATDVFQAALMFVSIFCIIGIGCYDVKGGISAVWSSASKSGRLNIFNFDPDLTVRHTWWTLTTGGFCFFLSLFAVNQIHVQRLLSAKSLKAAQLSIFVNTPMVIFMILSTGFAGLVLYAWFEDCDPVITGRITSLDQIMPYFAKIRLAQIPGLLGFFIAGIFSAALSTVSAMLNSLSAIAIADYIKPIYRKCGWEFVDSKSAYFGKILCIVNGLFCIAIAFLASGFGNLIQAALGINGTIGGPILGLFSLGMFVEAANETGAVIGTVLSLMLTTWMCFGQPKVAIPRLPVSINGCLNSPYHNGSIYQELLDSSNTDDANYFYLFRISYMLYTPLGMLTALLFGYIVSIIVRCFSKAPIKQPDPDLFTPMLAARMRRRQEIPVKTTTSQDFVLSDKETT